MSAVKSLRLERGTYLPGTDTTLITKKSPTPERDRLEAEIESLKVELANLVQEAEQRESQAYKRGLTEGFQQGLEEGRQAVEPAAKILEQLLKDINTAVEGLWSQCRESIVDLTVDIARKVIGRAAENTPGVARELAERCLKLIHEQAQIILYVNPQDAALLRAAKVDLMMLTEGVRNLEVVERANISRGGVILDSNAGQLDARIEEQLAAIETALKPKWALPIMKENSH